MNRVKKAKRKVIIIPAKLVSIEKKSKDLYGKMKGTLHHKGDIIKSVGDEWDADR